MSPELNRRHAIGLALALTAGAAVHPGVAAAMPPLADPEIHGVEDRFNAEIGLYAVDLVSSATLMNRPEQRFAMCSTFKAYAAGRLLQLADQGALRLETTPVQVAAGDIVANSPVTEKRVGSTMTLAELCAAALINSDNTAGNLLLRAIGGPPAITAFARSIGDDQTRLDRWELDLNDADPGDPRDTTTPRALNAGYRELLTGGVLVPPSRQRLLDWMLANVTSGTRFRAALPTGWTSADKTGAGDYGTTNDSGLLIGPAGQRLMVTVLTRSRDGREKVPPLNDAVAETVRVTLRRLGH
jgi:beta-lactamase class A